MNFNEFKLSKPEFVSRAKDCKNEEEFTQLAELYGIKFGAGCLEKAFKAFCEPNPDGTVSDEDLEMASGGTVGADLSFTTLELGGPKNTILVTD